MKTLRKSARSRTTETSDQGAPTSRRLAIAGYASFFLAAFLLSLLLTFPHESILERALASALEGQPVKIRFETASPRLPLGYRLNQVVLSDARQPQRELTIDGISLTAPLLGAIGLSNTLAEFDADAFDGEIEGALARTKTGGSVVLTIADIDLTRATHGVLPEPTRVGGRLDLTLDLAGNPAKPEAGGEGSLLLAVRDLSFEHLIANGMRVPDLRFTSVEAEAEIHGGRLQLTSLRADGEQLDLSLSGDILLRQPIERSLLNLRFDLKPGPGAPPGLAILVRLLPKRPDESSPWKLRGTLAAPSLG